MENGPCLDDIPKDSKCWSSIILLKNRIIGFDLSQILPSMPQASPTPALGCPGVPWGALGCPAGSAWWWINCWFLVDLSWFVIRNWYMMRCIYIYWFIDVCIICICIYNYIYIYVCVWNIYIYVCVKYIYIYIHMWSNCHCLEWFSQTNLLNTYRHLFAGRSMKMFHFNQLFTT